LKPVLEKYSFIPNFTKIELEESARIITQAILENNLESNFEAVEIIDDFTNPASEYYLPFISKALDDLPLVTPNLTISCKTSVETIPTIKVEDVAFSASSNILLIVASKLLQRPSLLNQTLVALSPT